MPTPTPILQCAVPLRVDKLCTNKKTAGALLHTHGYSSVTACGHQHLSAKLVQETTSCRFTSRGSCGTFVADPCVAVGTVGLGISTPGDAGVGDGAVLGDGLGIKQSAADARQELAQEAGAELPLRLQFTAYVGIAEGVAFLVEHGDRHLTIGLNDVRILRGLTFQTGLHAEAGLGGQRREADGLLPWGRGDRLLCLLAVGIDIIDGDSGGVEQAQESTAPYPTEHCSIYLRSTAPYDTEHCSRGYRALLLMM